MKKILLSLAVIGLLAGCTKDTKDTQSAAEVIDGAKSSAPQLEVRKPPVQPPIVSVPKNETGSGIELGPTKGILAQRSVFFDYDSVVVKDEFKPLVTAHSRYLADHRAQKIIISGNTDERGSREYNIALGQRRADSVKQMMLLLGVKEDQIESVSYGEEKPRNPGHDETAFAENRRGDIAYAGEK
ncbi:MAG: peptidoglycan-associated lipoprotein Pal [Burkholderiales bacterium]